MFDTEQATIAWAASVPSAPRPIEPDAPILRDVGAGLFWRGNVPCLMLSSAPASQQPGWRREGSRFFFDRPPAEEARAVPFNDIITSALVYAHEMERIV